MNPVLRMRLYWIEFDRSAVVPPGCMIGCGVTARSEAEVMELLECEFPEYADKWIIRTIIKDVEFASLDAGHIRFRSGLPLKIGIWFPNHGDSRRFRL